MPWEEATEAVSSSDAYAFLPSCWMFSDCFGAELRTGRPVEVTFGAGAVAGVVVVEIAMLRCSCAVTASPRFFFLPVLFGATALLF